MADEYIPRYDAETAIAEIYSPYGEDGSGDTISREDAMSEIRGIPAADVAPVVRGRWKRVDPRSTVVTFRCSECNYYAHMNETNFCPNCGADMREVQHDD